MIQQQNNNTMKTKTLILGLAVAILSAISLTKTNAQSLDQSLVTVVPDANKDFIKVIYNYGSHNNVMVKFMDADGLILKDRIKGDTFDGGFAKKYEVNRNRGDEFWLEVSNPEFSVTYMLAADKDGRWIAEFQKATQQRTLASR